MDILKSLFPWSFKNKTMKDLIISILIYMAINIVGGLVFGLLSVVPLIGFVFSLLGGALGPLMPSKVIPSYLRAYFLSSAALACSVLGDMSPALAHWVRMKISPYFSLTSARTCAQ